MEANITIILNEEKGMRNEYLRISFSNAIVHISPKMLPLPYTHGPVSAEPRAPHRLAHSIPLLPPLSSALCPSPSLVLSILDLTLLVIFL